MGSGQDEIRRLFPDGDHGAKLPAEVASSQHRPLARRPRRTYTRVAMATLILDAKQTVSLLSPRRAIEAVREAFELHGRGAVRMPPKIYLPLPEYDGDFRAMPAFFPASAASESGAAGVKWINAHPQNPSRNGLPAVIGVYILSDPADGYPLAVMDATELTRLRTGAAAAVASQALARHSLQRVGIIGCGRQSHAAVRCHAELFEVGEFLLYDRDPVQAEKLAAALSSHSCKPCTLEEAASADVVCTLTPSRAPVVSRSLIRPGTHINALGADAPGKQELDERILAEASVFLDDVEQATESGEVNVALSTGRLDPGAVRRTLGQVLAGIVRGRSADDEITVFDSTGLAVQDLALARRVYESACSEGLGSKIDLVGLRS